MHRGYHDFLSKKFCLTVPKNFVGEPFCVSKNFWYRKILCMRGGHQGLVENFLFHRTENLRKRSLVRLRYFLVWKKNMDKRWGGGYNFFPLKFFCLTVPENFVGTINVSEKFGYRKISRITRGCHYSTLNFFASQGQKNRSFEKILVSKIFMHRSGDATMIWRNFFFHVTEKFHNGSLLCFKIFLVWKKVDG